MTLNRKQACQLENMLGLALFIVLLIDSGHLWLVRLLLPCFSKMQTISLISANHTAHFSHDLHGGLFTGWVKSGQ